MLKKADLNDRGREARQWSNVHRVKEDESLEREMGSQEDLREKKIDLLKLFPFEFLSELLRLRYFYSGKLSHHLLCGYFFPRFSSFKYQPRHI